MLLNDKTIRELSKNESFLLVTPFRQEQLNPASYDVTLGSIIKIPIKPSWWGFWIPPVGPQFETVDISWATKENPYLVKAGDCFLASTREYFNLPDNISSMFVLKSSRARTFFNHMFAGFGDPGWVKSTYTLEMKNENKWASLPIYPGLKIGQVVFMETMPVELSYRETGHYNHQVTPRESWES